MKNRVTKEIFIKRSIEKHGNRFDYSKVDYVNVDTKVVIVCDKHGEFLQRPSNHMRIAACRKCSNEKLSKERSMTLEEFIKKANLKYDNFYIYDKVKYVNYTTNIEIVCPIHGSFLQTPMNHFTSHGCLKCNGIVKKYNTQSFIEKAKKIHKNKYDYSKVNYVNCNTKIIITCRSHGDFEQMPACHIYNHSGCPRCSESHGESKINLFLKENKINYIRQARFSECRNKQPLPFDFYIPSHNCCIEYDGQQHTNTNSLRYSNLIPIRDSIKTKFCHDNSIKLIRISYKEFNQIDQILNTVFKNKTNEVLV